MNAVRLRFAPCPRNFFHIGSLRAAIFNHVLAKILKGVVVLRIENIDQESASENTQRLLDTLKWLELNFDEGPGIGGKYGPYLQSERLSIYKKHLDELLKKDGAYFCFCNLTHFGNLKEKKTHSCRHLTSDQIQERLKTGESYVVRQKVPSDGEVIVKDKFRGLQTYQMNDLQDVLLFKSNGNPTYEFSSVIDDHLMEITHVVRGPELLSTFPNSVLMYKNFNWSVPEYIHLLVAFGTDGEKFCHTDENVSVEEFRAKGYLKDAIINFVALLDWQKKDGELFSLSEMLTTFDLTNIKANSGIYDASKFD